MGAADLVTTSIIIPRPMLELLRLVAAQKANARGRRASVSAVISEVLQQHEAELRGDHGLNGGPRR